jgi:hypothetical protein
VGRRQAFSPAPRATREARAEEAVVKGSGKVAALLAGGASPAPEAIGVLVVRSAALAAARARAGAAVTLFGSVELDEGSIVVRVDAVEPAPGLVRVGVGGDDAELHPGEARLALSDPPAATLDGIPLQVLVSDPARYRDRVEALPGAAAVAGKRAVLVGLGSVGSDLGARLVRLGVRVAGCDPDVLAVENLIRWGLHASLDRDVGRSKARVWRDLLRATVPGAEAHGHALDVVRQAGAFDALVARERPHLLIAATDTADSRRIVNAVAARHRIPALFVGLSDGAASVRVEVVEDAGRGPCHLCARKAEGAAPTVGRASRTPYSAEEAPGPVAVPALPIDVALGALIAARLALLMLAGEDVHAYLRHGDQRGNVLFLSLRPDHWVFEDAWDRLVYAVERDPECPTCGGEDPGHGG